MNNAIVGRLLVTITADMTGLENGLNNAKKESESAGKTIENTWDKTAKKLNNVGNTLTKFVTLPIAAGFTAAINAASDMQETMSKVDVVFGDNAKSVKQWSTTSIKNMGLAQETALSAAATYGNMADGMGIAEDAGLDMSIALVQLSADLASFNNTSQETARIALNSIFTGETETLKQYGIVMTQANLEQFALTQGIKKTVSQMSQAELVQLRYNYVIAQTTNAQGDFARTSGSVANQTRMAKEQVKEIAAQLGENLVPIASKVLSGINDLLKGFSNLDEGTQDFILTIGGIAVAAGPALKLASGAITTIGKIKDVISNLKTKLSESTSAAASASSGVATIGTSSKTATPGVRTFGTALNSALGIIGIAAAAVTALVGVFNALTAADEETQAWKESCEQLNDTTNEFITTSENNAKAIEAQYDALPDLIDEIYKLNDAEKKSSSDKKTMATLVSKLNTQYSGLGLSIDETTGQLSMSREEVEKYTKSMYENAKAMAARETYYETIKKITEAETNTAIAMDKVRKAASEASGAYGDYIEKLNDTELATVALDEAQYNNAITGYVLDGNLRESLSALKETITAENSLNELLKKVEKNVDNTTGAIESNTSATSDAETAVESLTEAEAASLIAREENNETLSESDAAALEAWKENNKERAESLEETIQKEKKLLQDRVDAATNANSKIDKSNQTSLANATKNLKSNTEVVRKYTNDMDYLYGKIPDTVYKYLQEAGIDQSRLVEELAEDLKNGGGKAAKDFITAYQNALKAGQTPTEAAATALGKKTVSSLADGIDSSTAPSDETDKQIKEIRAEINKSISNKTFYYRGSSIMENFRLGMASMRGKLEQTADSLMSSIKSKFNITISATTTSTGAKIRAYDVGGYFTTPQIIQIAEKRPEFVGAADDLESFISKSVNNAFVGVNPILLQDIAPMNYSTGKPPISIQVNVPIQVTRQLTDRDIEQKAKTIVNIVGREFSNSLGGLI